jgi:exodeoxyribonuclease VII large subunit
MTSFPDESPDLPANLPEYSVSELSLALKRTVEDSYGLVRVRGEISGLTRAPSGHVYFSLKDMDAALDGVMWRGKAQLLSFKPTDGLEVVCTGKLSTYPARSRYQLIAEAMVPAGAGALLALLEERKRKLEAEGLFASSRKKKLPFLPDVIGVVTSPSGAVIRDILHRLADRFPRRVLIWPTRVQGEGAADEIAAAIDGFNTLPISSKVPKPDLIIVARGGGSIEDLWAFNEETVVRAAAASKIPLISAVGHETDTTLIDYAADARAPTPTAAAEMAVPVRAELLISLLGTTRRLIRALTARLEAEQKELTALARILPRPEDILAIASQRLDVASERLDRALVGHAHALEGRLLRIAGRLNRHALQGLFLRSQEKARQCGMRLEQALGNRLLHIKRHLDGLDRLLLSVSHRRVLERGFALVRSADGRLITRKAGTFPGMGLRLRFADGEIAAQIPAEADEPSQKKSADTRKTPRKHGPGQGSLF